MSLVLKISVITCRRKHPNLPIVLTILSVLFLVKDEIYEKCKKHSATLVHKDVLNRRVLDLRSL